MNGRISVLVVLFVVYTNVWGVFMPRVRTFPIPDGDDTGEPVYLTPLIEAGKIRKAQHLSKVRPDIGNTTSYSGYFTTDKMCGNNLFFWFFPAQQDWEDAPIVLWLQGGPGGSSMFGLFKELGPFNSFPEGLQGRKYSWNVKNNLLFIDQPVGTGYSFTKKECYARNQSDVVRNLYPALVQFLKLFPKLQENDFFITGESYAGHYIPSIGYEIHKKNPSADLKINLKGMMIGDGWTDPVNQINYGDYLYQLGLIDHKQREVFYFYQNMFVSHVNAGNWSVAYNVSFQIQKLIGDFAAVSVYNYLPQPPDESNWDEFIQSTSTRRAIHVGSVPFSQESWVVYNYMTEDTVQSVKPSVEFLLNNNYPILFYVGQVDIICAYPMVINFLRHLTWNGQHNYLTASRSIWFENQEIAGYIKGDHLLFDVLVRDAGHMVPSDQPFWAYQLVNNFVKSAGLGKHFLSYMNLQNQEIL